MDTKALKETANMLIADDKGILAIDESIATCNKRFAAANILQTEANRHAYREMIITTPGLNEFISAMILFDDTIRQQNNDGTPFVKIITDQGIIPGIKVDTGIRDLTGYPDEKITEGLDGLRDRLQEYRSMGARFAKWRAVIVMGERLPTRACIEANARAMARYAMHCQEAGLVPIVEAEVLSGGVQTIGECKMATSDTLHIVFNQLYAQGVLLEGMILKPNMVMPGLNCPQQATADEIADATLECLLRVVPAAVPGIAFLSGGQSGEQAAERLNAMHVRFAGQMPWILTFSFARAIHQAALEIWHGLPDNLPAAQQALYHRARCSQEARRGTYTQNMEWTLV